MGTYGGGTLVGTVDDGVGLVAVALVLMKFGMFGVVPSVGGALLTDVDGRGALVTGADCLMIRVVGRLFTEYLKFCPGGVTAVDVTNGLAVLATGTRFCTVVCGPSMFTTEEDEGVCP